MFADVVQTYAADEAQRPLVLEVLDAAVQLHLTVLRAWAFNDGAEQWQALQTEPGAFPQASLTSFRFRFPDAQTQYCDFMRCERIQSSQSCGSLAERQPKLCLQAGMIYVQVDEGVRSQLCPCEPPLTRRWRRRGLTSYQ